MFHTAASPEFRLPDTALDHLDPDLQPYLGLHGSKEAVHPDLGACFICEGRYLVEEAIQAHRAGLLKVLSVLTTPAASEELSKTLPGGVKSLAVEKPLLERLLGFAFHRGLLCCVARPQDPEEATLLAARRLVVVPRLDNVDNLGQILRTATALGLDAVLAGPGPGPFDRRTVRVSMGAAWKIPILQMDDPAALLRRWRTWEPELPTEIIGAALVGGAIEARQWQPCPRTALVLGPEDLGLDAGWLELCDRHVRIDMARGVDSLNVAAAGAILMHRMADPGIQTTHE